MASSSSREDKNSWLEEGRPYSRWRGICPDVSGLKHDFFHCYPLPTQDLFFYWIFSLQLIQMAFVFSSKERGRTVFNALCSRSLPLPRIRQKGRAGAPAQSSIVGSPAPVKPRQLVRLYSKQLQNLWRFYFFVLPRLYGCRGIGLSSRFSAFLF